MFYQKPVRKLLTSFTICLGLFVVMKYISSLSLIITHIQQFRTINSNLGNNKINRSNRDRCCVSTGSELQDVCGRKNCTSTCSIPVSFIPELDNGKAAFAKNERAFFLETMGNDKLDYRQACAVESLAFLNPSLNVYVLFTSGQVNYNDATLQTLREKYKNLNFVGINLDDYVTGTPLEHWYYCTNWAKGPFHVAHLSDGLRLLTIAKYGGYYFDMDVIQLRPVTDYHNFTAVESNKYISSAIIHASYGHPVMQIAIEDFPRNYRSDIWEHNGPGLITRLMKKWCGVEDFKSMNSANCKGFHVLPQPTFNPLPYYQWKEYFTEHNATMNNMTPSWLTDEVIAVHVWNKMSARTLTRKNSTQMYVQFARKSCPATFSLAPYQF